MKLHLSAFVFWCLCFKVLIDVRSGRISLSFLLLRDIFFFKYHTNGSKNHHHQFPKAQTDIFKSLILSRGPVVI